MKQHHNSSPQEAPNYNKRRAFLVAGVASLALLGAKSESIIGALNSVANHGVNERYVPSSATSEQTYIAGIINPGAKFRTDPVRIEDSADGRINTCGEATERTQLSGEVLIHDDNDPNGPWVGIKESAMPEGISGDCMTTDKDGIVWTAQDNIEGR